MDYETIRLEIDSRGIATLTLARGDKHNSMSSQMIEELTHAQDQLRANDRVRAVILTGEGKSFCAGADLSWMKEQFSGTREQRIEQARRLAALLDGFNCLPLPLIGGIQGQAFGGGIGLICVCDVAVTVPEAKFGLTETRLGIVPATISPYVIARLGGGIARSFFMSGRIINSEEALQYGLVSRVVSYNDLSQALEREALPYLSCSPLAVASAKSLARSLGPQITQEDIERTILLLADIWETEDAQEGISAFLDKRPPRWKVDINSSTV